MNRFDSSKFGASKSEVCSKCGMHTSDSNGCCHDEIKVIKIQDDQLASALSFKFTDPDVAIIHQPSYTNYIIINPRKGFALTNHSPPLDKQNTYLLNCVFRI